MGRRADLGATLFAGGAAWFAYQTIKSQRQQITEQRQFIAEQAANLALERIELRAAAENRKWSQARQISMHHRESGGSTDGEGNITENDHWEVFVRNSSDSPVHEVDVRFGTAYLAAEVYSVPSTALSGNNLGELWARPIHLLGPGRIARFVSQSWPAATVHNNRPQLLFADDSGIQWSLDSYGKLEEIPAGDSL